MGAVTRIKTDRADECLAIADKSYLRVPVHDASVAKPFATDWLAWTAFGTFHLGSVVRVSALVTGSLDSFRLAIVLWRSLS